MTDYEVILQEAKNYSSLMTPNLVYIRHGGCENTSHLKKFISYGSV